MIEPMGNSCSPDRISCGCGKRFPRPSHWLSILEASFVVFKLPPFFENFGKHVTKSPKYYFVEPGLISYLFNIEKPEQVTRDPLVAAFLKTLSSSKP